VVQPRDGGITPSTPTPIDEWIAGESPDYKRHYAVHTCAPRFSAEFLEIRTETAVLHQVLEIDPVPACETVRLRCLAAEALAEWLDWWWVKE
jgi:hypothetical protein